MYTWDPSSPERLEARPGGDEVVELEDLAAAVTNGSTAPTV